jgi:hypothetical protein
MVQYQSRTLGTLIEPVIKVPNKFSEHKQIIIFNAQINKMSFDLYFYKKKSSYISEEKIAQYLSENVVVTDIEFVGQWIYENADTNVYFTIERNTPDANSYEEGPDYDDFINTNFSFSINYFRPDFFALETFPIIHRFMQDLDLYVSDPQDKGGDDLPRKFTTEELTESWIKSNNQVADGQHKKYNLEFMPADKSNYFWEYQYRRADLENEITEDIYVPNLFIIKETLTGILHTGCAWTTHVPLVLPKVDIVIIQKKYRKLFSSVEESGIIPYDTVVKELGVFFEPLPDKVPDLKILTQARADKLAIRFNQLKIYKTILEFGTGVSKDSIVNIPPNR